MTSFNADNMHRLAKLAMDTEEAVSPEEAMRLFSTYSLHIMLGEGWADTLAGQACFLTALNSASRAFLGGVEVSGDLSPMLRVPLYEGLRASEIVEGLGGRVLETPSSKSPTLLIGEGFHSNKSFCLQLSWNAWCAQVAPTNVLSLRCVDDNPLAGITAAALGVNEAFLYVRGEQPEAGYRQIGLSLWNPLAIDDGYSEGTCGPALHFLPSALWLVGLGHLGQAYAWTLGMLPYPRGKGPHLVLQDVDRVTESNLSTCLFLHTEHLGKRKVRVVGQRLEDIGFTIDLIERRFAANHALQTGEPMTALFGVDNVAARRDLDGAGFDLVIEAGLGSGYRDFRNIRMHRFPGPRRATEIWIARDGVQSGIALNDTYQKLAKEHHDLCGMTQLASRAVATPFVGVLAAALVLAEVIRPLHGGNTYSTIDIQMKNLKYRNGSLPQVNLGCSTPFVDIRSLCHSLGRGKGVESTIPGEMVL